MQSKITRRRTLQGLGAAGLAASFGMPAIAQNKPIRVGWLASVTGPGAINAQAQDYGLRMAVQDANEKGGFNGRKFEIVMRDTGTDPAKATSFAKELVFSENVDVVCGPANSGEVLPIQSTLRDANKLNFMGGSVEALVDPVKYPGTFRYINTSGQWVKVATKTIVTDMKKTKVAIFCENSAGSLISRDQIVQFLAGYNLKAVYIVALDLNKPDLTDEVIKAKEAGADVIIDWFVASGLHARLLNARGEQNWNVPIVAQTNILQEGVAKLLTKRSYWDNAFSPGYTSTLAEADGKLSPVIQAFMDKHKDTSEQFMQGGGLAAILMGQCAFTLYETGLRAAGDTDSAKIQKALEAMPSVKPMFGEFKFSPTDHNGFKDEGITLVEASHIMSNGGYPRPKL